MSTTTQPGAVPPASAGSAKSTPAGVAYRSALDALASPNGAVAYLPEELPAAQQPEWDEAELAAVVAELSTLPPLVFAGECDLLTERLAAAATGRAFVLQGGDCAETFADATADSIRKRMRTILQMAVVLTYAASTPVVKIGRMAGQFAKPRSSGSETRDGVTLPAYRGDAVNDFAFTPEARRNDPQRLIKAYHHSSATLNLIRAFTTGGEADLRQVHTWNKGFARNAANARYEATARDIERAISFMEACGAYSNEVLGRVEFYASHEALLLPYERALTRTDSRTGKLYDVSAHFLWIGERTRQLDGAHVDLLSRVRNPIGVKLGPTTSKDEVLGLIDKLDPQRRAGRLTFVTRMGAGKIRDNLPRVVEAVAESGAQVVWTCDPMHGNTITSPSGYKTRRFDDVIDEVRGFFEVHNSLGTIPGGLHVELTGGDVTEVLGGHQEIEDADLSTAYESLCDPRLNHQQSLEMAFLVAEMLQERSV
ncbi:3-deoxy-D-arabinoheptulosonate-7-phosphate synthase [Quadrisphaera granulorum]|uniref:Phospho-2-dehydro-3-deoxyheptonate aldolase n=1 Tax=Quadrisphaera granulorum TaxID=317664 RepID=A0A316A7Y0_9ACTN|nr:3-deoxy-7-phosphoheptulonate synthase class II [Quadrisphaera granulorum]PWJ53723.1 3-deoxy-D-arabinoheptulosonate-7-phosphate synthase [Quadrisphaera granulorum]SZE96767.1 3-deoxy-D-arabinoheptulosonate-7-phosphate synthase [Quadrisphaera granulorum]